jgi:hypothetical protein
VAFYISLEKIEEDDTRAQYRFYITENITEMTAGVIEIRKSDGHVFEIQPVAVDNFGRIFERAAWALMRHWREGEYPEKTCWAS